MERKDEIKEQNANEKAIEMRNTGQVHKRNGNKFMKLQEKKKEKGEQKYAHTQYRV